MGTGNNKVLKVATVLCLIGVLSMSLPNLAAATLYCDAQEVQVTKFWTSQGLVGAQVQLSGGPVRVWVLCNLDGGGIGERRCYEVLNMMQIAKATGSKVLFTFNDTAPDGYGGVASTCADIQQWINLEANLKVVDVKQ